MRFLRNTFGYFFAASMINAFWGFFMNKFGLFGAYGAALFLTGCMWYINHYIGLIKQDEDCAFIDMGLGVAVGLISKNYILSGVSSIINSTPTLICVIIGAVLGGYAAVLIERNILEKNNEETDCEKDSIKTINVEFVD